MSSPAPLPSPARAPQILWSGIALVLLTWAAAIALAGYQPWMGLQLEVPPEAGGQSASPILVAGGNTALPVGATLQRLQGKAGEAITLEAADLMEEPDLLPSYEAWGRFYARQEALASALRSGSVTLAYADAQGRQLEATVQPLPRRPLASLPFVFWFQLLVGGIGALVGTWVLGLRPGDPAARCLALTGLGLLGASCTAAVYSTRELALPVGLFTVLSDVNHASSIAFGIGLVGIFLYHPQPMAWARKAFAALAALWLLWGVADLAWWLPSADAAFRLIILGQMLTAIALGIWQWRRARGNLVDKAALRWVLLSFLVGTGAFIVLFVCTTMLGWLPPLSQGYAFGFFLTMYLGLALGVRRYRLFELDSWSLRALAWVFGALGILLVDALFVLLRWDGTLSLAASVLICAALYFPLRQWVWGRLLRRTVPDLTELTGQILALGLADTAQRTAGWKSFWHQVYAPLRLEEGAGTGPGRAVLLEQGLGLHVPAAGAMPALQLWQREQGRRLFSPQDERLAERLHHLIGIVFATRDAHEQGALRERKRIASDLHDDLGGKLLSIVHSSESPGVAALARQALDDMRLAVQGLMAGPAAAEDVVADWRGETANRVQAAGMRIDWNAAPPAPGLVLQPSVRMHATRMLREAVTNAIKHSGAQLLEVEVAAEGGELAIRVRDDGTGIPPADPSRPPAGQGLASMGRRAHALGGEVAVTKAAGGGTEVHIRLPLDPVTDNAQP